MWGERAEEEGKKGKKGKRGKKGRGRGKILIPGFRWPNRRKKRPKDHTRNCDKKYLRISIRVKFHEGKKVEKRRGKYFVLSSYVKVSM